MVTVIGKALLLSIISIAITYLTRLFIHPENYLSDVGGLSAFATVFGTLYGIMTAFIVFEVWAQYNKISQIVGQEALGLERLFRLALNFKNDKFAQDIKRAIKSYANLIIEGKFKKLGQGERNTATSSVFRKITKVIQEIKLGSDKDRVVFDHLIRHYEELSKIRTERVDQSLIRLPGLLKYFLYISSFVTLLVFIVMPFSNLVFSFLVIGVLTFIVSMILLIVEDLDNPFIGYWNITPEPFERALKHIDKDYNY